MDAHRYGPFRLSRCLALILAPIILASSSVAYAQSGCSTTSALAAIGVTPKTLCVAGATANDASSLLSGLTSSDELTDFLEARATLSNATENYTDALAGVRESSGNTDSINALDAARAQLLAAISSHATAKSELVALTSSLLPSQVATRLQSVQTNVSCGLPVEYAGLTLTEADLRTLALAVRAAGGETPPDWAISLLSSYNSTADVLNAVSRLTSLLDAIDQVFGCG